MTQPTLVLVCKRPALGNGKQRLAAKVGGEIAYQIAEALLACVLEDVMTWPGKVIVAPADTKDHKWAENISKQMHGEQIHSNLKVISQTDGNLGQRLNALDQTLRSNGFNHLIYIGSDAPDITPTDFSDLSKALLNFDTVLKPTLDGGVSIMASRKPWPELSDLPWSTSQLGDSLSRICLKNGHTVTKLQQGFDVDEYEDLSYLVSKLADDQRPARRALVALAHQIVQMKTSKQKVCVQRESDYV